MPVRSDRAARWLELVSPDVVEVTMQELLQSTAEGEGLASVARRWDVPYQRVYEWLCADVKRFSAWKQALEASGVLAAQEAAEVAKESGNAALQVKERMWTASALSPIYRQQVEVAVVADPFGELLRRVSERHLARLKAEQPAEIDVTPGAGDVK